MKKYTLANLDCPDCALNLEKALHKVPGVRKLSINFATASMLVEADDPELVVSEIARIEPQIRPVENQKSERTPINLIDVASIVASLTLLVLAIVFEPRLHDSSLRFVEYLLFGAAYGLAGWKVVYRAIRALVRGGRIFDENFLMTVATAGAIGIHQLAEAVAVMLFYSVGELLQAYSVTRSRRSIRNLLELQPDTARVIRGGSELEVPASEVRVGDEMMVRPGERLPTDGIVASGSGFVQTSAISGEPTPIRVEPGSEVLAGYISEEGALRIKATHVASDSAAARIIELVENASQAKAKSDRFISRFAQVYTPIVLAVAALVALLPPLIINGAQFETWLYRALVMLVISCPCALVVSIPLSYFSGIGGASSKGILVKGATFFDALARVRTVVFDKTGTLTRGVFEVQDIVTANGESADSIMRYVAHAEANSNHPIAESIRRAYTGNIDTSRVSNHREYGGFGIVADIDGRRIIAGNDRLLHREEIEHDTCDVPGTAVHVGVDGRYAGYIIIGDDLKPGAENLAEELRDSGIRRTVVLTGDTDESAKRLGRQMRLDESHGDLLPEDKVGHLERIISEQPAHERTAFVGDGINDAPVLARADVGIAIGGTATDIAIETADVVLLHDSPSSVVEAIRRAKKTRRIVFQNIFGALGIKLIFLVLGAFGIATMWEAVIGDVGVTLIAVLNAVRALR